MSSSQLAPETAERDASVHRGRTASRDQPPLAIRQLSSSLQNAEIIASLVAAAIAVLASVVSLAMPLHWSWLPLGLGVLARLVMLMSRRMYRDWHLASALLGTWIAERGIGKMSGIHWNDDSLGAFLVRYTGWEADAVLVIAMLLVLAVGRLSRYGRG